MSRNFFKFGDSKYCIVCVALLLFTIHLIHPLFKDQIHWFVPNDSYIPKQDLSNKSHYGALNLHYAFFIPYRNRPSQLKLFLEILPTYLLKHNINYTIFIVEQDNNGLFNRGLILNAAFDYVINQALKPHGFFINCYIIHDVDLLPLHQTRNPYHCSQMAPLHLSTAIDEMRFNLLYPQLMGGVTSFTESQYIKVNGFSNMYEGWGAEDDDMAKRIQDAGFPLLHLALSHGTFAMMKHKKSPKSVKRWELLKHWGRWPYEGLNSLKMAKTADKPFTHVSRQNSSQLLQSQQKFYNIQSIKKDIFIHLYVTF